MEAAMSTYLPMSRRRMLTLSASSLLAAGLWPGALHGADGPADDFHFLVVNDVHNEDEACARWLEGIIKQMKGHAEKPAFCLVVGDLSEHGKFEQLEPVRTLFRGLGMPVHVVIGNHDYLTNDDRKAYHLLFPDTLNYTFTHGGWQFVALDSTEGQSAHVNVPTATLRWLDEVLPLLDKKRPMILFTHMPLGPWVIYRAKNAEKVLDRFKEYNLKAVFNGHFHSSTERRLGAVTLTTNRCCAFRKKNHDGTKEKGYFLCRVKDGKVERRFVEVKV
jgi:hypothetical protein